jgi:hypothetical protein
LAVSVLLVASINTTGDAQVHPPRWHEEPREAEASDPPVAVLGDGHVQFPDGTVQQTAAGSGESLGAPPSPSLVLASGGIEFPDGSVQTTAAGSLVPQTGQTICYDTGGVEIVCTTNIGPGQDGDLQRGVPWPGPRFTVNESSPGVPDGTVTDNLTGLIWLANANCAAARMDWATALAYSRALFDGCTNCGGTNSDCGLQDGSMAGQWRLPNARELHSLAHYGVAGPAVPNTAGTGRWEEGDPFSGVQSDDYWSSTSDAGLPTYAWFVNFALGLVGSDDKEIRVYFVWPVRGGQ